MNAESVYEKIESILKAAGEVTLSLLSSMLKQKKNIIKLLIEKAFEE